MSSLLQDADETGDTTDGVADGGDGRSNDRLLSVAEIQHALGELRARRPKAEGRGTIATAPVVPAHRSRREEGKTAPAGLGNRGDSDALAADWIAVVAAHSGAGASTVALAISDAAATLDRRVHLVETAHPRRSGLIAAASAELGTDAAGAWRRGSRDRVTIDRRVADVEPGGWPVLPISEEPAVTVLDLGLPAPEDLARLAADRTLTVVVCRPTAPGVRLTEHVLGQLAEQPVVVAVVGPAHWPQAVNANCGPRLRELRSQGRVVRVPIDRRLQTAGLTGDRLPSGVEAAGRSLAALLIPAVPPQPRHRHPAAAFRPAAAGETQ